MKEDILNLAVNSELMHYDWPGRGKAPAGYVKGMALMFGRVYCQLKVRDSSAVVMASKPAAGSIDAMTHYASEFKNENMTDSEPADILRHLFVLQTGLGMRESSGQHCCGRDMSAHNISSEEAESGLFQMSWNAHVASPEILRLFRIYSQPSAVGFLDVFREGVYCDSKNWQNYGSGDGFDYQHLAKNCPAFAVEAAAVGLRKIRTHWGPIDRGEVKLSPAANHLYLQIQKAIDAAGVVVDIDLTSRVGVISPLVVTPIPNIVIPKYKPDVSDITNWSCAYPYEYSDWANHSWYGNLDYQDYTDFDLNGPKSRYLGPNNEWKDRSSDTNEQYGEYSIKIDSTGWNNWIGDQLQLVVDSGVRYKEWDNQDNTINRSSKALELVFQKTFDAGIKPILKNPTVKTIQMYGKIAAGCVFEEGEMSPLEFADAREGLFPNLQATWVRFGGSEYGHNIPSLMKQVVNIPGTSVQWGPTEYNGMRIVEINPLKQDK